MPIVVRDRHFLRIINKRKAYLGRPLYFQLISNCHASALIRQILVLSTSLASILLGSTFGGPNGRMGIDGKRGFDQAYAQKLGCTGAC